MTAQERKILKAKYPEVKFVVSCARDSREDVREMKRLLNLEPEAVKANDPEFLRDRTTWAKTKVTRADMRPVNVRVMCYRKDAAYLKAFARATFLPGFSPVC